MLPATPKSSRTKAEIKILAVFTHLRQCTIPPPVSLKPCPDFLLKNFALVFL
jgi:hypothetical protein